MKECTDINGNELKVGDKVKRVGEVWGTGLNYDSIYTISKIDTTGIYVKGNDLVFTSSFFELVVDEVKPKFKAGDKVRCTSTTCAVGVEVGNVYTIKDHHSHYSYTTPKEIHVKLEEVSSTPSENVLELINKEFDMIECKDIDGKLLKIGDKVKRIVDSVQLQINEIYTITKISNAGICFDGSQDCNYHSKYFELVNEVKDYRSMNPDTWIDVLVGDHEVKIKLRDIVDIAYSNTSYLENRPLKNLINTLQCKRCDYFAPFAKINERNHKKQLIESEIATLQQKLKELD